MLEMDFAGVAYICLIWTSCSKHDGSPQHEKAYTRQLGIRVGSHCVSSMPKSNNSTCLLLPFCTASL